MLAAVLVSPFLYSSFTNRISFPSDSDQDEYLKDAQITAEQFAFARVRPLYSSWLAGFYLISGKDLRRCLYLEKTVSVLMLSLLIAFLGLMLFDGRTALLLFIWVLNCKYLMTEPNGSHALAASMLVASVLCFYLPVRAARLPASLFIMFLSLKVREEMIVPLTFIVAMLVLRAIYRWKKRERSAQAAEVTGKYYWIGAAIIFAAMLALFAARPNNSTSPYISVLIRTEFAGTYVRRTGLIDQLPGKKPWVQEAWDVTYERLPGVKKDFDVIRMYPREELANIIYNVKITPRVASAMFLSFDRPKVMLAAFLLYFLSFIIWPGRDGRFQRWRPLSKEIAIFLVIWGIGSVLIVGLVLLLYISSRHYVQLIPAEIIVTMFIVRLAMSKLLPFIRPSSRESTARS